MTAQRTDGSGNIALVAFLTGLCVLITFWSGHLDTDSCNQLDIARRQQYPFWPPPMMSWVWGALDAVRPGPVGMWFLQTGMFFAGLGFFIAAVGNFRWAFLIPLIGFFPPVLAVLTTIYKDTQMGAALLLAVGLLAFSERQAAAWPLLIVPIILTYAIGVRYNAIFSTIPLFLWWGWRARELWFPSVARWAG